LVDPARAVQAFSAVLIVACPCALALSAPFTLGTALRVLGRAGLFVKNGTVIERLPKVDQLVFDKTGTLAAAGDFQVAYEGAALTDGEHARIAAAAARSTHPYSMRLAACLGGPPERLVPDAFEEVPARGLRARFGSVRLVLGSRDWLEENGAALEHTSRETEAGGEVWVALDGRVRGRFTFAHAYRPGLQGLFRRLAGRYRLAVLSGDTDREMPRLKEVAGEDAELDFNQSPLDKLHRIRRLQEQGRTVLMAGDGLNDAGALRQADVGVAVVENMSAFSPASDAILEGKQLERLDNLLRFGRSCLRIIYASFALSFTYNAIGLYFAATGRLSPLVCAVLMPLSSVTVVAFAVAAVRWRGRELAR